MYKNKQENKSYFTNTTNLKMMYKNRQENKDYFTNITIFENDVQK